MQERDMKQREREKRVKTGWRKEVRRRRTFPVMLLNFRRGEKAKTEFLFLVLQRRNRGTRE